MFNKILKVLVYAIVFLLPIFWLPFSFEFLEFNKLYLLFFLSWTGVLIWLLKEVLQDKEIRIRWAWCDPLIFIFVLIAVFSFVFSDDKFSGIFGTYGRFNNGLLALFAFLGFYLLIRNNLRIKIGGKEEEGDIALEGIFNSLFFSAFLVLLWTYFSLSGFWLKIPHIQEIVVFNPASFSVYSLAVFLSLMIVLVLSRILLKKELKKVTKVFYVLFLVLSVLLLLLFDFFSAWILLSLSLIFFVIISLRQRILQEESNKLIFPIFLIIISLIFSFLNFENLLAGFFERTPLIFNFPREPILGIGESWEIGFKTATANVKNGFLGSGIGTFLSAFSKFNSDWIDQEHFWLFRLDRASGNFAEVLATLGFLGAISFLLILVWLLLLAVWKKTEREWLPWRIFLIGLIILPFIFYQNMVLGGLFWLGLAIGANLGLIKEKRFPLKDCPEINLVFSTLTVILALLLMVGCFFGLKFYLADYYYQKAFFESDLDKKMNFFQKSVNHNSFQPYYQMAFSQALILKVQQELENPPERQDLTLIQNLATSAVAFARRTTDMAPSQALFWQNLANIYRDLGANDLAMEAYQETTRLEPFNPHIRTEIGRVYLAKNEIEKAREKFLRAIELRPDYAPAHFQMAMSFVREGRTAEAIVRLEELKLSLPNDAALAFHLGVLYYNDDRFNLAKSEFERAIRIDENYSNARYFLGLVYEKEGKKDLAIEQFEKVQKLNPENEHVMKILNNLREGKPALEGIVSEPPLLEEDVPSEKLTP